MRFGAAGLVIAVLLPVAATAQLAGRDQVALATAVGTSYARIAQCLTTRMTNSHVGGLAVIFTAPTAEAFVHLWQRGNEHGVPIGVFLVREDSAGGATISFSEPQPGRLIAAARAAVEHCAR